MARETKPKRKVIARKNFPSFPPLRDTALAYLLLAHFDAPGWVWGATGCLIVLLWIAALTLMIREEMVDLFDEEAPRVTVRRSAWNVTGRGQ